MVVYSGNNVIDAGESVPSEKLVTSALRTVKIDASVVDPKDTGMLQDLIVAAVNQALGKAKALAQAELAKATGGLSLPGMPPII